MVITSFFSFLVFLGTYSCRSKFIWGCAFIQREKSYSFQGRSRNKLECEAVNSILFMRHNCWLNWWLTWSWWRIYLSATLPWTWNPSSGIFILFLLFSIIYIYILIKWDLWEYVCNSDSIIFFEGIKCYIHFCNDIFCIYVCGGILPSETFSHSIW